MTVSINWKIHCNYVNKLWRPEILAQAVPGGRCIADPVKKKAMLGGRQILTIKKRKMNPMRLEQLKIIFRIHLFRVRFKTQTIPHRQMSVIIVI